MTTESAEKKHKSVELNEKVRDLVAQLANETDQAHQDAMFKAYLDTSAKFHRYSWHNQMLIWSQRPTATRVMGFRQWNTLNRFVRKGEKGIAILAPMLLKKEQKNKETGEDETKKFLRFRVVYVFDVAQTDGEALPEIDVMPKTEGEVADLFERLSAATIAAGVSVGVIPIDNGAAGYYDDKLRMIAIAQKQSAAEKFATLVHERAHSLLHTGAAKKEKAKTQRELEAEATSYVVVRHFGMQHDSRFYLADWGVKASDLLDSLPTIQQTAKHIIDEIEGQPATEIVAEEAVAA